LSKKKPYSLLLTFFDIQCGFIEKLIDDVECEILKPEGIEEQKRTPIKEYVDVNSAIALAGEALRI